MRPNVIYSRLGYNLGVTNYRKQWFEYARREGLDLPGSSLYVETALLTITQRV